MRKPFTIFCSLFILLAASCGIDDYPIIYPSPQSNIRPVMNSRAEVRVPNNYADTPFTHFAVFYRIYVSDAPQSSITSSIYSAINPSLSSDYNVFANYIDSTTQVNANMDSLFTGRGYKYLYLQGQNINSILSSRVHGTTIEFDFSSSKAPTMTANGTVYTLWRSNGNGLFNPQPDRLFMNHQDLYRSDYINDNFNADVAANSSITGGGSLYTYAAMFIAAVGINPSSYAAIYSTPSLIHVFQLPNR
jgi:hypothetical protein